MASNPLSPSLKFLALAMVVGGTGCLSPPSPPGTPAARRGLAISGLGYYPNPLHPDPAHREQVIGHLRAVMVAARKMGVPLVNTFMGGDGTKDQDHN